MNRLIAVAVSFALPVLAEGPMTAPRVRIVAARPVTASTREAVTGQLGPSRMLPLGFEVGGRLTTSRVSKGDLVKVGQALGNLDTEIINAQVAQAEAGLMAAEASAALALDVAARNEKLRAEGSISDIQFKQTDTQARGAMTQRMTGVSSSQDHKIGSTWRNGAPTSSSSGGASTVLGAARGSESSSTGGRESARHAAVRAVRGEALSGDDQQGGWRRRAPPPHHGQGPR